jgi:hypothetical protein
MKMKTSTIQRDSSGSLAEASALSVNDARTVEKIDACLTRACSTIDLRRVLISRREKYGADTPIGHRITNLVGALANYDSATGAHRTVLTAQIEMALTKLAELTSAPQ